MIEFTGERVIPGRVPPDLLNEHLGRYSFAEAVVAGKCILDAGCGVGYGSARLAALADTVYALDNAAAAVRSGHAEYRNVRFVQGDCSRLPFQSGSLDAVAAFEVIEHLQDWEALIHETARVLRPAGTFLVSTPNRIYYEGSRDEPNPFHIHEFDYEEFCEELAKHFPNRMIFFENHANAITFMPGAVEDIRTHIESTAADPAAAHFFLAVCSHSPIYDLPGFVYLPRGGNILHDRERHIEKLEKELAQKNHWLKETAAQLENLTRIHREDQEQAQLAIQGLEAENERKTQWAKNIKTEIRQLEEECKRAVELLDEAEARVVARTEWAQGLDEHLKRAVTLLNEAEARVVARTEWAQGLDEHLKRAVTLLNEAEARVVARTEWAQGLDEHLKRVVARTEEYHARIEAIRASLAYRAARRLGLAPAIAKMPTE